MTNQFLYPLNIAPPDRIGGKARQLQFLQKHSVKVPETHVCVFIEEGLKSEEVLAALGDELTKKIDLSKRYAVRSSANVEDGARYSFAGQFETVLDVAGLDALTGAIAKVWVSAKVEGLRPYLTKSGLTYDDLQMGVIVQEMVAPVMSGVAFSKNPITGMDETIVEAVAGSGELLVQEGMTPFRWVHKWGEWMAQPEASPVKLDVIAEVVAQTKQLAVAFGAPVDLEWVYDGTAVTYVQIREITALKGMQVYSNRISREVLPGLIKPLIWSVNVPLVNSAWIDIFTELIGPNEIDPDDLSKSFHYRAYFNMSTLGRVFMALGMPTEVLELMMGIEGGAEKPRFKPSGQTYRHLPRMIRFMLDKLRFGRKLDAFLPEMAKTYAEFERVELSGLDESALLREIDKLYAFTQKSAYANIVGPLLMAVHNNMLQKRIEKLGVDYVNFDLMENMSELESFDPNIHLQKLHDEFSKLADELKTAVSTTTTFDDFLALNSGAALTQFQDNISAFIRQFGHFSDSGNDFSMQPWRENRELVLKMIINYEWVDGTSEKVTWQDLPVSGLQAWRLQPSYRRARQFRLYREAVSYRYTHGYGLFRNYFLALADRLVARRLLLDRQDIFYLYLDEVRLLVENGRLSTPHHDLITTRQQEMEAAQTAILPEIIYGEDAPPLETAVSGQQKLNGVPTSRGYHQGPVRVIQSVTEFDKMVPGAVIVIPFSDVSWTPLFTKAGAVIAESGGMLSHSSIVAREYNLPAVVSVNGACRLLSDDQIVSVDGYKGEISIQ